MIECSSCHTLNPDAERACLACGAALSGPAQAGAATMGMARCPAGHPIDPSWKSCPYCDRQQAAGGDAVQPSRSTRLESDPAPRGTRLESAPSGGERRTRLEGESWPGPASSPPPPPGTPKPTRLEEPFSPPGGARRTLLQESPPDPAVVPPVATAPSSPEPAPAVNPYPRAGAGASPARRLLAVLAAPGLGPGGAVFAVRGGKNTIGAGRGNDIVIEGDSEMSGEHAAILHRGGMFHLADRLSTNGTWVNGQEAPANGTVPLRDRDRIRCGCTELVFLVIDPGSNDSAGMDQN